MTVVSGACVDCATPIIGDRPRCPACHDRHATALIAAIEDAPDDAITAPRPRAATSARGLHTALAWFVMLQLVVAVVLGFMLAVRGCRP